MSDYSPPFAPHVRGSHPDVARDPETGAPEPLKVELHCAGCGAREARPCDLGRPRALVHAFALAHLGCAGKIDA